MKSINKTILGAVMICCSLSFTGCSNYLDLTPTNEVSDKLIWSKSDLAELAVNDFYNSINLYGSFGFNQSTDGMTEGFTETLKYGSKTNMTDMDRCNLFVFAGVMSASWASYDLGAWDDLYNRIRRVNEALSDMKKYSSFDIQTTAYFSGQLRFFRAFYYFELLKRYKDVILYDEDLSKISAKTPISTETKGWDMVEADLEFAGKNLPVSWAKSDFARITSGAAYALLSRSMLYAERWDVAQSAASKVINSGNYALAATYADAFKSGSTGNKEAILEYDYNASGVYHNFDDRFSPKGDPGVQQGGLGTPTQEMVESYELAGTGGFPDWSEWHTNTGTTTAPPYDKLEPRFQASILYNGSSWKGRTIEPFVSGIDGWCQYSDDPAPAGRTTTGYYLRKLIDETHNLSVKTASTQPWISIRYAEVLLNFAEACYHTGNTDSANIAVKAIRARVGLPYTSKSGTDLMTTIRQERKVELSYEGLLFWDMRRWQLAATAYTGYRVHGLKIVKNLDGSFTYTYVDCDKQDRYFPSKLYRLPLPQDELTNNTAIQQYPEWR